VVGSGGAVVVVGGRVVVAWELVVASVLGVVGGAELVAEVSTVTQAARVRTNTTPEAIRLIGASL
jgi:hypothetical protein